MKYKNMSFVLTLGVVAIVYAIVNILNYILIEKGLLLFGAAAFLIVFIIKTALAMFIV